MNTKNIFDFTTASDISNWNIMDDVVMGGRSNGRFTLNDEGWGVFEGKISLQNNGGFSSVRYNGPKIKIENHSEIILKIRGDGKRYQFRIKSNQHDDHSYIQYFETTDEWQEISVHLKDMYPTYRGRKLDMPNFSAEFIEEIGILIGNGKEESFKLLIDSIQLKY